MKLGCSTEDKSACTSSKKGTSQVYDCFCKGDHCNGSETFHPGSMTMMISTVSMVIAKKCFLLK